MRNTAIYIILALILIVSFIAVLLTGDTRIPLRDILEILFTGQSSTEEWVVTIFREFRLPKALTAVLAGMALSVSGLQMQTVFRNPLAGPYVLGISAGASLGVAIIVMGVGLTAFGAVSDVIISRGDIDAILTGKSIKEAKALKEGYLSAYSEAIVPIRGRVSETYRKEVCLNLLEDFLATMGI